MLSTLLTSHSSTGDVVIQGRTLHGWPIRATKAHARNRASIRMSICHDWENSTVHYRCQHHSREVVLGIDSETKLRNLSSKLEEASVDHKLWIEQPEDIPTCLVTKPYLKEEVQKHFKKLKLFKAVMPPDTQASGSSEQK
ncbi:unnamed protein product, partial [Meganyctiphanes norvegica]